MKWKWNKTKQNEMQSKRERKRIDFTVPEMLINLEKDFELFAADLEAISTCKNVDNIWIQL